MCIAVVVTHHLLVCAQKCIFVVCKIFIRSSYFLLLLRTSTPAREFRAIVFSRPSSDVGRSSALPAGGLPGLTPADHHRPRARSVVGRWDLTSPRVVAYLQGPSGLVRDVLGTPSSFCFFHFFERLLERVWPSPSSFCAQRMQPAHTSPGAPLLRFFDATRAREESSSADRKKNFNMCNAMQTSPSAEPFCDTHSVQ